MRKRYSIRDMRRHFFEVASWVNPAATCDVVFVGDPDAGVGRIGTGWSCCSRNLETAAADGCDLFICHESLFHGKAWAHGLDSEDTPWGQRRRLALANGMACMRLHDTWDNFPDVGIRDAWRRFLGLTDLVDATAYHCPGSDLFAPGESLALSRIEPMPLRDFAARLADRCAVFPCFQGATVQGDLDAEVRLVATGVGCHIPTLEMLERGADVLVLTFDRALQETIRIPLSEMNANLIVVEHGVAEMPGMREMASYLERTFPGIEAAFYCREPRAVTIVPARPRAVTAQPDAGVRDVRPYPGGRSS